MAHLEMKITLFEPVEDGYLFAFVAGSVSLAAAIRAIVALDPWQRRWLPAERAWWIADDAITLLARRLPALAELLCQWHEQSQRPPDIAAAVAAAESASKPSPRRMVVYVPPAVAAAYRHLELAPGAPAEQVAVARRILARRHHPDTGGAHASMVAVNMAADTVLRWLQQHR